MSGFDDAAAGAVEVGAADFSAASSACACPHRFPSFPGRPSEIGVYDVPTAAGRSLAGALAGAGGAGVGAMKAGFWMVGV